MPLLEQYELSGVRLLVWKVTETLEELQGMVLPSLAARACEVFASEKRCTEWLAVRALLRSSLGDDVHVVYDTAGKPSLEGIEGDISISHTDGYVAVALSTCGGVGVDIELLSRNVMAVAGRFMSVDLLGTVHPDEKNFVALVHWCAKEALYKIVGNLGGNFKDNISVGAFEPSGEGSVPLALVGVDNVGGNAFVADYSVLGDLLVVLCRRAV